MGTNAIVQRRAACCDLVSDVACRSGRVRLKVNGTSMLPAVWPGDVVTVQACDFRDLQPGHIVLYRGESRLTAHRIARVADNHLILRGDSLPSFDPPVADAVVVGTVVGISRKGRHVSLERSRRHKVVSSLLRRSHLVRRVTLRLGSGLWHS